MHSQAQVEFTRNEIIVQDLLPVQVDRGLAVANETDTTFHESSDVDAVCVSSIGGDDADATHLLDGHEAFVDGLRIVGLEHHELLGFVDEGLWFMEGACAIGYERMALKGCAVGTYRNQEHSPSPRELPLSAS